MPGRAAGIHGDLGAGSRPRQACWRVESCWHFHHSFIVLGFVADGHEARVLLSSKPPQQERLLCISFFHSFGNMFGAS